MRTWRVPLAALAPPDAPLMIDGRLAQATLHRSRAVCPIGQLFMRKSASALQTFSAMFRRFSAVLDGVPRRRGCDLGFVATGRTESKAKHTHDTTWISRLKSSSTKGLDKLTHPPLDFGGVVRNGFATRVSVCVRSH